MLPLPLLALFACSHLQPDTWATFRADPQDGAAAIVQALGAEGLEVEDWNQEQRSIRTAWSATDRARTRLLTRWRAESSDMMTVYVDSERERRVGEGPWTPDGRDPALESRVLERIRGALDVISGTP